MKAFLIDPEARTVAEIDIDPANVLRDLYAAIDCQTVEVVAGAIPGHDLWLDEEGALYDDPPHGLMAIPNTAQPILFGRAVVLTANDDGDCTAATCTAEEIAARVFAVTDLLPGGTVFVAPLTVATADSAATA
jgi:hypothetical protein